MINYLKGVIRRISKEEARVVLDVNGVGYELLLPYFVMRSLEEEERGEGAREGVRGGEGDRGLMAIVHLDGTYGDL